MIPDWVCEIISPGSARTNRMKKMRIYAQYKVSHAWLVDPMQMMVEVYRLEAEKWAVFGVYAESDKMRAEPFQEIEIDLSGLWLEA